jgi:hypothetical protein
MFGSSGSAYPGVVELGLHADHVALLLVLRPEDLELRRLEGPVSPLDKSHHRRSGCLTTRRRVHLRRAGLARAREEGSGGSLSSQGSSETMVFCIECA